MATRNLSDADAALVLAYTRLKTRFEATFPEFELRPFTVYRSPEEQLVEFKAKKSQLDGFRKKSKHNEKPSKAIDVGIFRRSDGAWIDTLVKAGDFPRALHMALYWCLGLLAQREGLRWGGDWNGNGLPVVPDPEESLNDVYHVEIA
jgi:hypothetical protein